MTISNSKNYTIERVHSEWKKETIGDKVKHTFEFTTSKPPTSSETGLALTQFVQCIHEIISTQEH